MSNLNLKKLASETGGVVVAAAAKRADPIQGIVNQISAVTGIKDLTYSNQLGGIALETTSGHTLIERAPMKEFRRGVSIFLLGFDYGSGKKR